MTCLSAGFAGPVLDVAAAIAAAGALGCPAAVATPLLAAYAQGMMAGKAEWE